MRPLAPDIGDRVPQAEYIVSAALAAFEAQDWQRLVELTDRDGVVTLRKNYMLTQSRKAPMWKLSEFEVQGSEVNEAMAEYLASRREFGELAGITTIAEVEALSNDEFLIRWAQARDPRYLVNGVEPWHNHQHREQRQVVGSVAVTPDVVAVVVRALGSASLDALSIYSMIAVIGDGAGLWFLDAATGWLGLGDLYG